MRLERAKWSCPRLGHFDQEGRTVQMFAIKKTSAELDVQREIWADDERPFHFIGHQANLRMLEKVCERCKIAPDRHHSNAEWFGNTGAASGASVLSQNWDKWKARDDVAMVGVGAGLTWGSLPGPLQGDGRPVISYEEFKSRTSFVKGRAPRFRLRPPDRGSARGLSRRGCRCRRC